MSLFEGLRALARFRRVLSLVGGLGEVRRALGWSNWYAVKWWEEIYRELGLKAIGRSAFARALYLSLRRWGYVREDGQVVVRPKRPEYPQNSYMIQFVELHESLDRLGAVNVAINNVDENTMQILYSSVLSQPWHAMMRRAFLQTVGLRAPVVVEPHVREGAVAFTLLDIYTPQLYLGYDYRRDSVELAAAVLKAQVDRCSGRGVCLWAAPTACDFVRMARQAVPPRGADALLLLDSIYFMGDPAGELACLRGILRPRGLAIVGQTVVDSAPGPFALAVAFGAKHVLGWRELETLLSSSGYRLRLRYLKYFPLYAAIWSSD